MALRERLAEGAERKARMRKRHEAIEGRERKRALRSASNIILVIGLLFVLGGLITGFSTRSTLEPEYTKIVDLAEDELLLVEGDVITVAERRAQLDLIVRLAFGVYFLLAAIMLGLYFWSRRSPFPAILTALCVYLAVHALVAMVDPTTLFAGLPIKIVFIVALVMGVKVALRERTARLAQDAATS